MQRTSLRELAAVAAGVLTLAVVATWPVAARSTWVLPGDLGDPLLNTFILAWNATSAASGFGGYWNAPFFYPYLGTLAFSEHLAGIALFTAPFQWLSGNPVLVYNLAFLGSYVLAGLGMYLLARDLWGRRDAAWVAAVAFAFAPHRVAHVSHLQVLMSGWMPVGLWCLHRYFRTGSRRSLAGFVAAFCLNGLSNGYFLYFFAIAVGVVVAVEFAAAATRARGLGWRGILAHARRVVLDAAASAVAILVVVAPFAFAYVRVRQRYGFARSPGEIAANSGRLANFLNVSGHIAVWRGILTPEGSEFSLFPGLTILALAAVSLLWLIRHPDAVDGRGPRRGVVIYAVLAIAAVWLTLGPGVWGPYRWLLDVSPGLNGLRVPARFIVVVALALAALAGGGAAWIGARLPRRAGLGLAAACTVLVLVEGTGLPVEVERFDPGQRQRAPLNDWLAGQPRGAMLELPVAGPSLAPFSLVFQYNALAHGHPVVNGYSGYGSLLQDFLGGPASPLLDLRQIAPTLEGLRGIGIRYVTLHSGKWDEWLGHRPKELAEVIAGVTDQVEEERYFSGIRAWRLAPPVPPAPFPLDSLVPLEPGAFAITASAMSERLPAAFDKDLRSRWFTGAPQTGQEWIRIEFARETDVARLVFDMDAIGVGDYPRELAIEAEAADGVRRPVFSGSIVPQIIQGIATSAGHAPAVIDLPPNATRVLWIRQLGQTRAWYWGINEFSLFRR